MFCYFCNFFMSSYLRTCHNWNGRTALTLANSEEKLLEILNQYSASVKCPVLSSGVLNSQHLNSLLYIRGKKNKNSSDAGVRMPRALTGSADSLCSKSALIFLSCVTWDQTAVKIHKLLRRNCANLFWDLWPLCSEALFKLRSLA